MIFLAESCWPSDVAGWVTLISLIVGLIGAIVALVPTIIKLFNALKEIIKNKNWNQIKEIANDAMKAAEESGKSGAEKQEMVIAAVKAGCKTCGVELDDKLVDDLVKYINDTIKWFNDMSDVQPVSSSIENKGE